MVFGSIVTVSFNKCIFTGTLDLGTNEGLYIGYIYNVTISNCLFHSNNAHFDLYIFIMYLMWKYLEVNSIKTQLQDFL